MGPDASLKHLGYACKPVPSSLIPVDVLAREDAFLSSRSASPRRPWLAGLLSLTVPGLGQVYAGRAQRGLILAVTGALGMIALLYLSTIAPHRALRILALALMLAVLLYIVWDAVFVATRATIPFAPKRYNRWYVYVGLWVVVGFVLQPLAREAVLNHLARAFRISSRSMDPTLLPGDYLLAAPFRAESAPRSAPVVVQRPDGPAYVHRVVGLAGDTIEMRQKALYINGRLLEEGYVRHIDTSEDPSDPRMLWQREYLASPVADYRPTRDTWGPLVIPAGHYFELGDNRDNSYDSRYVGFIARPQIVMRPVWIYFSRDPVAGRTRWERFGAGVN